MKPPKPSQWSIPNLRTIHSAMLMVGAVIFEPVTSTVKKTESGKQKAFIR